MVWFGDVPGKRLRRHRERLKRPETPDALRRMPIDRLPEDRRTRIDIFVLDVTKPW